MSIESPYRYAETKVVVGIVKNNRHTDMQKPKVRIHSKMTNAILSPAYEGQPFREHLGLILILSIAKAQRRLDRPLKLICHFDVTEPPALASTDLLGAAAYKVGPQ